jgi:hypothetical protein
VPFLKLRYGIGDASSHRATQQPKMNLNLNIRIRDSAVYLSLSRFILFFFIQRVTTAIVM